MEEKKIKFDEKFCKRCDEPVIEKITPCPLLCMSPKCDAYFPRVSPFLVMYKICQHFPSNLGPDALILLEIGTKPKIDSLVTPILWVLGGPGCGKGTQCAIISKKYNFTHLSTGDLLREEVEKRTDRARCIANVIARGDLVSTDIVLDLLKKAMLANLAAGSGFLVDGYPREASQGEAFERVIAPVTTILYFSATRETLKKRLMHRAQTSNRLDDNEVTIERRLDNFFGHKDSIIEKHDYKVNRINAEGPPETIAQTVTKILDPILENCKRVLEERTQAAAVSSTDSAPTGH